MAPEEVTVVAPLQSEDINDAVSPQIGVFVTADVRVVQYRSNECLGNFDSTKCTIVTSLSAVINESVNRSLRVDSCRESKNCVFDTMTTAAISKDEFDCPVVRRSKKHTQLNNVYVSEFTSFRRAQIDRKVLLPYLGCTKRFVRFRSYNAHVLAKSSKSWERVGKSFEAKSVKPFRSQIFTPGALKSNTSSGLDFSNYPDVVSKERLVHSSKEYELPNTGFNVSKEAVRSFYLIKTPTSGAAKLPGKKNATQKTYEIAQTKNNSENPAMSYLKKNELHKNITGFEGEILAGSAKWSLKTTRNVSILHRPKTRDKSTSTTYLDCPNFGQDLDKSIQGLLLPYISNGRDFPSEIVLKLVPKAEALKNASNENTDQSNKSKNSSEINLLAPILNTDTKSKKKSGKKSFWNCFSNKKKTDDDTSNDDSNKEVYFPSIVEVHNKNKKLDDQPKSDLDNSVTSIYTVNKTNK